MASQLGVSSNTVRSWLSILEQSYVVYLLQLYYSNAKKRLIKTPKVYFYDTGLLCSILSFESVAELTQDQYLGPVFENAVISEQLKLTSIMGGSQSSTSIETLTGSKLTLLKQRIDETSSL